MRVGEVCDGEGGGRSEHLVRREELRGHPGGVRWWVVGGGCRQKRTRHALERRGCWRCSCGAGREGRCGRALRVPGFSTGRTGCGRTRRRRGAGGGRCQGRRRRRRPGPSLLLLAAAVVGGAEAGAGRRRRRRARWGSAEARRAGRPLCVASECEWARPVAVACWLGGRRQTPAAEAAAWASICCALAQPSSKTRRARRGRACARKETTLSCKCPSAQQREQIAVFWLRTATKCSPTRRPGPSDELVRQWRAADCVLPTFGLSDR